MATVSHQIQPANSQTANYESMAGIETSMVGSRQTNSGIQFNRMVVDPKSCSIAPATEQSAQSRRRMAIRHQDGYASDDEASDCDEPYDSGRTRSSARRAKQQNPERDNPQENQSGPSETTVVPASGDGRGRKRKKGVAGQDSDSEPEEGDQPRRKLCPEPTNGYHEDLVCSCPKDVMKCIGILPSLPIVSRLCDSDDSDSSLNDDLSHTVLPRVSRNRNEGAGC